jgi:hypothetical protein
MNERITDNKIDLRKFLFVAQPFDDLHAHP